MAKKQYDNETLLKLYGLLIFFIQNEEKLPILYRMFL